MSGWLSLAITVILVVVAYVILNRTITNRTSQQAALDDIKREVGAIITELNSTTERNIELIEDRIHTLENLIEQADRRVTVLRRDLATRGSGSSEAEPTTYSRLASARRPDPSHPASGTSADTPPSQRAGMPSSDNSSTAPSPSAGEPSVGGDTARSGTPDGNDGSRDSFYVSRTGGVRQESDAPTPRQRIRMLYLQGLSLERIASIVGKTVGEVELIVSLDEGTERKP